MTVALAERRHAAHTDAADIILIPKPLRMEWTDAMALDAELSHVSFRIGCIIGAHFNRNSGHTFVGQATIARLADVSDRTVRTAVAELEQRGYLVVERVELGTHVRKTKAGDIQVRSAGGRGVANAYRPAFQKVQLGATNRGQQLVAAVDRAMSKTRKSEAVNPEAGFQVSGEETWKNRDGNLEAGFHPTLTPSCIEQEGEPLERARARVERFAVALDKRIGHFKFTKWFEDVGVWFADGVLIVRVTTDFKRNYIQSHFLEDIIAVRQSLHSSIERVEVTVRQ